MQVTYGGIPFQIVKTNRYQRDPVLSEDRTELLFMRSTRDVTMIYNPAATSYVGDGGGFEAIDSASPGQTDVAIRYHLLKPRRPFTLADDDGTPQLVAPALGADRDPDHGPHPVSSSVDQITPKS